MDGETCHKIEFHRPPHPPPPPLHPSAKLTFRHGGIKSLKNEN